MKNLAIVSLLSLAVMTGVAGAVRADSSSTKAQKEIAPIMAKMEVAANAHDTDRFLQPFLHDPSLVFVVNGMVIHGWQALHEQQRKWWKHGKSDATYTQVGPTQIQQLAKGLVLTTRSLSSRRTGPDGKTQTGKFAVTEIWRQLPQGWRIIYAHESWQR